MNENGPNVLQAPQKTDWSLFWRGFSCSHFLFPLLDLFSFRCKFFSLTETPEDYTIIVDEEGFKGGSRLLSSHLGNWSDCVISGSLRRRCLSTLCRYGLWLADWVNPCHYTHFSRVTFLRCRGDGRLSVAQPGAGIFYRWLVLTTFSDLSMCIKSQTNMQPVSWLRWLSQQTISWLVDPIKSSDDSDLMINWTTR